MKKFLCAAICLIAAILIINSDCFTGIQSFYSGFVRINDNLGTGSVAVSIQNLSLQENTVKTAKSRSALSGSLAINTAGVFSFTIRNDGKSGTDYRLNIEIAWDGELNESGNLFVYPYQKNDAEILSNLQSGDYTDALINPEDSDTQTIELSTGVRRGIIKTLDRASLAAAGAGETSKDYIYKLFFFGDAEVLANPSLYQNKNIEVIISVTADVQKLKTEWAVSEKNFFRVVSVIDIFYPAITEVAGPRTFFAGQAAQIKLADYASAADPVEGDITSRIKITPASIPAAAGEYIVTYTVTNSSGVASVPLRIIITVWDFAKIVNGDYHSLALTSHGRVYSWGSNYEGQLGLGKNIYSNSPKLIKELDGIVGIAAGRISSYALTDSGEVYAWGDNSSGQLGLGAQSGYQYVPAKLDLPAGVRFTSITAGFMAAGAVTETGEVYTWGSGENGVLGSGNATGRYSPGKINLSNITGLSLNRLSGAAVTADGALYTWGGNHYGQLGNGQDYTSQISAPKKVSYFEKNLIKISSVSVGSFHMAAVSDDGKLFTWGYGAEGGLGNGVFSNFNVPQKVNIPPVKKAVCGSNFTGAITAGGTAYFFGRNYYGQHGSGDTTDHFVPEELKGITGVTDLSVGMDFAHILNGAEVFGTGYGESGNLGNGKNDNSYIPVKWLFAPPAPY